MLVHVHAFIHDHGLLQDEQLRPFFRPVTGSRYDPMHCLWSNGIFGHALWKWCCHAKRISGIRFCHLNALMNAHWECPSHHARHLRKIKDAFSDKRERSAIRAGAIHLSASDGLSLYPLVRRFAEQHAMCSDSDCSDPDCSKCMLAPYTRTLLALLDVADVVQQAKKQQFVNSRADAGHHSDC